jgi:hypothetical protein
MNRCDASPGTGRPSLRQRAIVASLLFAAALPTAAATVEGLCLAIVGLPENKALFAAPLHAEGSSFTLSYVHSATRTPVRETYRVDSLGLTQIEIRFSQPAAGLPTEAAPGETWGQDGEQFVVTMARRFDGVRVRVSADKAPMLDVAGRQTALTQWGEREIGLVPIACSTGSK